MGEPNEFQKANISLIEAIRKYALVFHNWAFPIAVWLANMLVILTSLALVLGGSMLPIFFVLSLFFGEPFDLIELMKYAGITTVMVYVGFALMLVHKHGENAEKHLHDSELKK